ncbi:MAG: hypothetical protein N2442_06485 [Spirochaetes bacterium]|nr:hypothetical protein [Spirochaetota bacterium]
MGWMQTLSHSVSSLFNRFLKGKFKSLSPKAAQGRYSSIVTRILSDAMLFNEVSSTPEAESPRGEFILHKLHEFGICAPYRDERGNIAAIFPASRFTDKYVLLYTDIGAEQYSPLESLVHLIETRAKGMGISDESIAVAALLNFTEQMQTTLYEYPQDVVCLFTNLSEEAGEFKNLEYFLNTFPGSISFTLYVYSIQQGIFEPQPLGQSKVSVRVYTLKPNGLNHANRSSAVAVLSHITFQLGTIQWDIESKTALNIARIDAGVGFGYYPTEGTLELELFSRNDSILEMMKNTVIATIEKIATEMGVHVEIKLLSHVPPGNPDLNSVLLSTLKEVYQRLKIHKHSISIPTKTTFLHSFDIPAITLGITRGKKGKQDEYIEIEPIEVGFQQLPVFLELGIEAMELNETE